MKKALSFFLMVMTLAGCSHIPESTRVPASASSPCGLTGTLKQRISDCASSKDLQSEKGHSLVTRFANPEGGDSEIYQDTHTKLLWTDPLSHSMPYHKARVICKDASLNEKGNLSGIKWRLASKADYSKAQGHGLVKLLKAPANWFWTSSTERNGDVVWLFFGGDESFHDSYNNGSSYYVRCVGEVIKK